MTTLGEIADKEKKKSIRGRFERKNGNEIEVFEVVTHYVSDNGKEMIHIRYLERLTDVLIVPREDYDDARPIKK
ncbi:hypothetical protein J4233_06405 [Candidatus Pacearchaeota archaeon]|nr:hypothetical protein [Candidatus Pacearchaeota archaeon]